MGRCTANRIYAPILKIITENIFLKFNKWPFISSGLSGIRIGIESISKVWNACGLRIGALVTDNKIMFQKARSEYTANLCANVIGQYVFGFRYRFDNASLLTDGF